MTKYEINLTEAQQQVLQNKYPNLNPSDQLQQYVNETLVNQAATKADDNPDVSNPKSMTEFTNKKITDAYLEFQRRFSRYLEKQIDTMSLTDLFNLSKHPYIDKLDDYIGSDIMTTSYQKFDELLAMKSWTGKPQQLNQYVSNHMWNGNDPDWREPTFSKEDEELLSQPSDKIYTFKKVHHSFMSDWIDPIPVEDDPDALSRVRAAAKDLFSPNYTYTVTDSHNNDITMKLKDVIINNLADQDLYDSGYHPNDDSDSDDSLLYGALGLMNGMSLGLLL